MTTLGISAAIIVSLAGCDGGNNEPMAIQQSTATDITQLSDEFDQSSTLGNWQRVEQVEGWNNNQLESFEIGRSRSGWMTMVPFASTWYQDYRGILAYKSIKGDFVVTTKLHVSRRGGEGAPRSQFSLAGIMVRAPRKITPSTWRPGNENYVFLSLGAADEVGRFKFEVKTTVNSNSQLTTEPTGSGDAIIRVARIGGAMIMLKNVDGRWSVHRRFRRNDFPETLQVGLTCYTDWPTASQLQPYQQNGSVIRTGNPDLVARFDYVRFNRPAVPKGLEGGRFEDPSAVSDARLLQFLAGS